MAEGEYDYSNELALATQMKSWMAINPSFGCIWDCVYCIQHKDEFFDSVNYKKIHNLKIGDEDITPLDVISEIMTNPRITSKTPLTFFNFSDPFLPQNTKKLSEILKEMDEREFGNIVGLITRTYAPDNILDEISNLEHIKPVVLVSYAGYEDRRIESAPNSKRIELIKRLSERNIPVFQYLRPVVSEWVTEDQFKRTRDQVGEFIDGVIMSGLRLTPEIIRKIQSKGLEVPRVPNHTNKYFPTELQQKIVETYEGVAPVYRYTSCAISSSFNVPDYNAHFDFLRVVKGEEISVCPLPCNPEQKAICSNLAVPSRERVQSLADKIGYGKVPFEIVSGRVIFQAPIPKEDLTYFRHNLSRHVDYDENSHHFDQVYEQKK